MFYERRIKYLDYRVRQEKSGSAGFVKLEARGDICNLTINICGLKETDSFTGKIYLTGNGKERELCSLELIQGRGTVQLLGQNLQDLGHTGIAYAEAEAMRMPISAEREIYGVLKEGACAETVQGTGASSVMEPDREFQELQTASVQETLEEETFEYRRENGSPGDENPGDGNPGNEKPVQDMGENGNVVGWNPQQEKSDRSAAGEQRTLQEERGDSASGERGILQEESDRSAAGERGILQEERGDSADEEQRTLQERKEQNAPVVQGNTAGQAENVSGGQREIPGRQKRMPLLEDKWRQLSAIYPHITPFQDEREYLSIGPNDFVILPGKYYRMVNNSFLLHGYYNYRHLILKKLEVHGGTRYYIGVPGNFYDREKQVAVMFGFESFECRQEPAGAGDYGYYLMRIEL